MGQKKVLRMHAKNNQYFDVKVDVDECSLIDVFVDMYKLSKPYPRLILPTHPRITYSLVVGGERISKEVGTDSQLMEMFEVLKDRSVIELWLSSADEPCASLIAARKIARAGSRCIDLSSLSSTNKVVPDTITTPPTEPNPISPRRVKKVIPPGYWTHMRLKGKLGKLKEKRPLPAEFLPRRSPRKHIHIESPSEPITPIPQPAMSTPLPHIPTAPSVQPEDVVVDCEAESTPVIPPAAPTTHVGDKSQPGGSQPGGFSSRPGRKLPVTTARRLGLVVYRGAVAKDVSPRSSGRGARPRSRVSSNTIDGEQFEGLDSDSADSSYVPRSLDEESDHVVSDLEPEVGDEMPGQSDLVSTWFHEKGPVSCWSKHMFNPNICSDANTSNFVESFNALLGQSRNKPVLSLLEDVRRNTMDRNSGRLDDAEKWDPNGLTPYANEALRIADKESMCCKVYKSGMDEFEIKDGFSTLPVSITKRTCACGLWQIRGIPCKHAVRALNHVRAPLKDYVSSYYSVSQYKHMYSVLIRPIPDQEQWQEYQFPTINPPILKRGIGRPPKARIREAGEKRKGKRATSVRCGKCKQIGHNARTCKGGLTAREQREFAAGEGPSNAQANANSDTETPAGSESSSFWDELQLDDDVMGSAPWTSGSQPTQP